MQSDELDLWRYEKGAKVPQFLPIKRLAQEKDLYGDKEERLASEIEGPANKVLEKIINRERISFNEKEAFSLYIFVFFKRVLRAIDRLGTKIPGISNRIEAEWETVLDEKKLSDPAKADRYERLKKDVRTALDKIETNELKEVWLGSLLMNDGRAVEALKQMKWSFLTCNEPDFFLTSDNPVFIHESMGIGKMNSEMTFPLTKNILLFANRWNIKDLSYAKTQPELLREANRRTVFNATRFVYSPVKRDWIATLVNKRDIQIHLISPPMVK